MKSNVSDETRFKQQRGTGDKEKYKSFLRIRDFSSLGRTHRVKGQLIDRHYELFSDLEYHVFCHFDFAVDIYDIKEQFPLNLTETLEIAQSLGIEHSPMTSEKKFVMTLDFLIIKKDNSKLAISVKPSSQLNNKRVLEKLEIDRAYWASKGIDWILVTEKELDLFVLKNLKLFREKYILKLKHASSFTALLTELNWSSNQTIGEVIRELAKKCKITFGEGRQIFTQLLAKKQVLFDYSKFFSIEMPIHEFKMNMQ